MSNNVDLFYDSIDEACLILYEQLQLKYLDCLLRVGNDILHGINESGLAPETINQLDAIYQHLFKYTFVNEDIRQALQLLIIKAFKHENLPLDLMTPDAIAYLMAFLVGMFFDKQNIINILDIGVGTGNLINAISNFLTKDDYQLKLFGIEREERFARLAQVNTDLQGNEMQIFLNDVLSPNYLHADVIIGDLDAYYTNDEYYPYLVINQYVNKLTEKGFFIYLIDNDFFNKQGVDKFREQFTGTMLGLIVLPEQMFQKNIIGKSILIGTNMQLNKYDMMVISLSSLTDNILTQKGIDSISKWINDLKGMI